jgi:hypothetical protein
VVTVRDTLDIALKVADRYQILADLWGLELIPPYHRKGLPKNNINAFSMDGYNYMVYVKKEGNRLVINFGWFYTREEDYLEKLPLHILLLRANEPIQPDQSIEDYIGQNEVHHEIRYL